MYSVVIPKVKIPAAGYTTTCTGDGTQAFDVDITFKVDSVPAIGFWDVYPTNIPGLGVKYHFASYSANTCGLPFDQTISNTTYTMTCRTPGGATLNWVGGTSVEFIATGSGPISAGSLTRIPAVTVSYSMSRQDPFRPLNVMYSGAASGSVGLTACTTPNVSVDMGNHKTSEFLGVGSFASPTAFKIALNNCPAGINTVKYQLDPVTATANPNTSILALNASSTAKGIAVQILDDSGKPFQLSKPMTFTGYNTSGGSVSIPLSARYYQTSSPITPGSANASLTFTMTYQ